jgi:hypothetical protein
MRRLLPLGLAALFLVTGCKSSGPTDPNGNGQPSDRVPAVGDVLQLNVATSCDGAADVRTGVVRAVSNRAIVVVDEANPSSDLGDADWQRFANEFDQHAYPSVAEAFGEPSDVDRTGRITVFFTRWVNELSEGRDGSFVGGVFWPGDLFPKTNRVVDGRNLSGCANSNERDMFYMLTADPQGVTGSPRFDGNDIRRMTLATMAHELQHLVNYARRLFVHNASGAGDFEDLWLNEALSHLVEERVFYRTSGLGPGMNIDGSRLGSANAIDPFNAHQAPNFGRLARWLEAPGDTATVPLNGRASLGGRGSSWSFVRYAADRRAGDRNAFLHSLVNTTESGLENISQSVGGDALTWMRDWSVATYAADLVSVEARYRHPSWNFRDLYPRFQNQDRYPLAVQELRDGQTRTFGVAGTGAVYVGVYAPADRTATVRIRVGGAAPPAALRLSVVNERTGEVRHFDGPDAGTVEIAGGNAGTQHTFVAFHATGAYTAELELQFSAEGGGTTSAVTTHTDAQHAHAHHQIPSIGALTMSPAAMEVAPDHDFHARLYEEAVRELAPLTDDARAYYRARDGRMPIRRHR